MTKETKTKKKPSKPTPERRNKPRRSGDVFQPNFKDMVQGAVQGILVHRNFKPLYANKSFAQLFGYRAAKNIMDLPIIRPLYPEEDWPMIEDEHNNFIHGEENGSIGRMLGVNKKGEEIWISATKRLIDWDGEPAVQISAFDISKQVEMEQIMMDNEQRLRAVLEILPVPVYIARRGDGKILYVNRKTCLLLEQSTGPLLRSTSQEYFADQEDHVRINQMVDTVPDVREIEIRMKSAQGREFIAELAAITMSYGGEPAMLVSMNDISQRKKLEEELFHQANTDALTGISNRRYFMFQAEQETRRALRFSRTLSVIMMDLDHFKNINDTYGHAAGDSVLETIVRASLESLRESDIMGRLGGEEFAILLPETTLADAKDVAGRLLKDIAKKAAPTPKGAVHCTASLGVAQMKKKDSDVDVLLARADEALFRAKDGGRNRVEVAK